MRRTWMALAALLAAAAGCGDGDDEPARDQGPGTGSGIPGDGPDLSFAEPPEALPGTTAGGVRVRFVVRYDAPDAVPVTDIRWVVIREDRSEAAEGIIASIASGPVGETEVEVPISPVEAGERLTIRIDSGDRVAETSELDNVAEIVVDPGPPVAPG